MKEIIVKSQKELDLIPVDYEGKIIIDFGTRFNPAIVNKRYLYYVEARGNSSVEARENSSVVARGNSSVVARGNSSVEARENSSVEARENSSVVARGNSSVVARGNSSVVARGNSQIVDRLSGGRILINGNARIVYMPKTIREYCRFYGIEIDGNTGKFYKSVHKDKKNGRFFSDHNHGFQYVIGETAIPDSFDASPKNECGKGIHIAHLNWALDFGRGWNDLAILEVEAKLDDIIVPDNGNGKVRCKEAKIIREIPLEECGLYGKILAKQRKEK